MKVHLKCQGRTLQYGWDVLDVGKRQNFQAVSETKKINRIDDYPDRRTHTYAIIQFKLFVTYLIYLSFTFF